MVFMSMKLQITLFFMVYKERFASGKILRLCKDKERNIWVLALQKAFRCLLNTITLAFNIQLKVDLSLIVNLSLRNFKFLLLFM